MLALHHLRRVAGAARPLFAGARAGAPAAAGAPGIGVLGGWRAVLGGVRTRFSVDVDGPAGAEFAVARLNRKMQRAGVMRKLRTRNRGFVKPSKRKYDLRLARAYKLSYRRVQAALTWIEMEQMFSARRRRAARVEEKARRDGSGGA